MSDDADIDQEYRRGLIRCGLAANGVDSYNQLSEYKAALARHRKTLNPLVMVMVDQLDRGGDRDWRMIVMLIAMRSIPDEISAD